MKAKMLGGVIFSARKPGFRCHSFDFAGLVGAIINMNFESFDFPILEGVLCVG
jgi:hypothetical protein